MTIADVVARAKAEAVEERRLRADDMRKAAELIRALPDLMAQERWVRGLTRTQAAQQAGVQHNVWGRLEARQSSAQSRTSARILEWMANG